MGSRRGKGAIVCRTLGPGRPRARPLEQRAFGTAGLTMVVEEFLHGEEVSFFAVANGTDVVPLAVAQDHKTVFDDDRGPNTGGMGAYSPASVMATLAGPGIMADDRPPGHPRRWARRGRRTPACSSSA